MRSTTGVLLLVCWLAACAWPADDDDLKGDIAALKGGGVAVDEAGLLEFLQRQIPRAERQEAIEKLIKQLGDNRFQVREKATLELTALGPAALAALQKAKRHNDAEIATRAKLCLKEIESGRRGELLAGAARVLSARAPEKAIPVLLELLPGAAECGVADDIVRAVSAASASNRSAHPALIEAVKDPIPLRRAAAGEALAARPEHRPHVRDLLNDADLSVRLRVALALVTKEVRDAVPVLLDLSPRLTRDQLWQVEDVVHRLGGPAMPPPTGDDAEREQHRAACLRWWKENGAKVDFAGLKRGLYQKAKLSAWASQSWPNPNGAHLCAPDNAVDGNRGTVWNAGDHPAPGAGQWIEVDLHKVRPLGVVRLMTSQLPDGPTTHEIWVSSEPIGADRAKAQLAHTFKGHTRTDDILRFDFPDHVSGRYVQIRTTESPSWVGWAEIELGVR